LRPTRILVAAASWAAADRRQRRRRADRWWCSMVNKFYGIGGSATVMRVFMAVSARISRGNKRRRFFLYFLRVIILTVLQLQHYLARVYYIILYCMDIIYNALWVCVFSLTPCVIIPSHTIKVASACRKIICTSNAPNA